MWYSQKSLSPPFNTVYDTNAAVPDGFQVMTPNDTCEFLYLVADEWLIALYYAMSTGQLPGLSSGARIFLPFDIQDACYASRQLFGTEDMAEEKFLIEVNPPCLFFNNESSQLFRSWIWFIIISSIRIKLK